jgi:superfamily I DNA/RNA helicase
LAVGEKLGLTVPALIKRFRWVVAKVDQLGVLGLPELVDTLLPAGADTIADLRAAAVDALVEAETPHDLLRLVIEAVTQDDVPQNPDFVRVMSLHKSKGLTSQSVYIAGAIDGILPTITSDDPAVIDAAIREGRRLFYVAVTRAASELVISGSISMDLGDANNRRVKIAPNSIRRSGGRHTCRTIASPYVAELGPDAPKAQKGEAWLRSR